MLPIPDSIINIMGGGDLFNNNTHAWPPTPTKKHTPNSNDPTPSINIY
jgi:hypothetical protein